MFKEHRFIYREGVPKGPREQLESNPTRDALEGLKTDVERQKEVGAVLKEVDGILSQNRIALKPLYQTVGHLQDQGKFKQAASVRSVAASITNIEVGKCLDRLSAIYGLYVREIVRSPFSTFFIKKGDALFLVTRYDEARGGSGVSPPRGTKQTDYEFNAKFRSDGTYETRGIVETKDTTGPILERFYDSRTGTEEVFDRSKSGLTWEVFGRSFLLMAGDEEANKAYAQSEEGKRRIARQASFSNPDL